MGYLHNKFSCLQHLQTGHVFRRRQNSSLCRIGEPESSRARTSAHERAHQSVPRTAHHGAVRTQECVRTSAYSPVRTHQCERTSAYAPERTKRAPMRAQVRIRAHQCAWVRTNAADTLGELYRSSAETLQDLWKKCKIRHSWPIVKGGSTHAFVHSGKQGVEATNAFLDPVPFYSRGNKRNKQSFRTWSSCIFAGSRGQFRRTMFQRQAGNPCPSARVPCPRPCDACDKQIFDMQDFFCSHFAPNKFSRIFVIFSFSQLFADPEQKISCTIFGLHDLQLNFY